MMQTCKVPLTQYNVLHNVPYWMCMPVNWNSSVASEQLCMETILDDNNDALFCTCKYVSEPFKVQWHQLVTLNVHWPLF